MLCLDTLVPGSDVHAGALLEEAGGHGFHSLPITNLCHQNLLSIHFSSAMARTPVLSLSKAPQHYSDVFCRNAVLRGLAFVGLHLFELLSYQRT
jgi:hypothetical protein